MFTPLQSSTGVLLSPTGVSGVWEVNPVDAQAWIIDLSEASYFLQGTLCLTLTLGALDSKSGCGPSSTRILIYTLWLFNIAMENGPFIDGLPIRRKFRSQTFDNMDRWKAEQGRSREKRKIRRKKSRRERVRRKKMQMREKVGKSRNTVFFQWFGAPEGRKVGSLKRRVRGASWPDERWKIARRCGAKHISKWKCTKHTRSGPLLAVEMLKKRTPLWREAHVEVKMHKTHQVRTTFGSWDVEKGHAVVARSTFWSQNVQNTPASDHFWKLRCRKSARRCGAKHISKSKCTKHTSSGPLLAVEMSKKWTPLWREAHFEVKMLKTPGVRTTFGASDVEKVHAVVARRTFRSKNVQNTRGSDHFWGFRCRFASIHYTTGHYTTLHSSTLHYTTLHSSTLHYTKLHYTTLHYTEWHSNTDRQVDS